MAKFAKNSLFDDCKIITDHDNIIVLFVMKTPCARKFITANGSKSFAVINSRGVSTNKTIICFIAMQTYKELNDHDFRKTALNREMLIYF